MTWKALGLALLMISHPAEAEAQAPDVCAPFQDQTVNPISFEAAIARFAKVPKEKGEFETTAEFQQRQAAALGGSVGAVVIRKEPDRKYIKYDADTQRLWIETYLFDNVNFDVSDVLDYNSPIKHSSFSNIDVVISQTETPEGSYEGTNSFGAKAEIIKVKRTSEAIFDREGRGINESLFQNGGSSTLIELTVPPASAKYIKENVGVAFLVAPHAPYVLHGGGSVGTPTISNPLDVHTDTTVLFADIQCAFLLDPNNKVLGSIPTQ